MAVDDQRVDAELRKPRGDGEAGMAAAHHQHGRIAVGIGALLREPVEPVVGAEVACRIGLAAPLELFFVAAQFLQVRIHGPGGEARRVLLVADKTHNAAARPERGVEAEQAFDRFLAGA